MAIKGRYNDAKNDLLHGIWDKLSRINGNTTNLDSRSVKGSFSTTTEDLLAEIGQELEVFESTTEAQKQVVDQKTTYVATVESLTTLARGNVASIQVQDQLRGGAFTWKSTNLTVDNGIVFPAVGGGYWVRQFYGPVLPEWFGAVGYNTYYSKPGSIPKGDGLIVPVAGYYQDAAFTKPVVDSTDAIQAAIDAAANFSRSVQLLQGNYFIRQIGVADGMTFKGLGCGDFGRRSFMDVTVLIQLPGVNDDAIVFKTNNSLGSERVTSLTISDFILRGHSGSTVGNGINFRKIGTDRNDPNNHAVINGTHRIENIMIREFPENGVYCMRGGVPAYLRHINCFMNGGYGIRWDGTSLNRNVVFENIDGDGNKAGAVLRVAGSAYSNVSIYNTRCEVKDNTYYGVTTGFDRAQPYVIEIGDMTDTSVVNVYGAYANAFNTPKQGADAVILVNCTSDTKIPFIAFHGISSLKHANEDTANRSALYDKLNDVRINESVRSGVYSRRGYQQTLTGANLSFVVGGDGTKPPYTSEGAQIWAKGNAPLVGGWEDDAPADRKGFAITNSGGSVQGRMITDAGVSNAFLSISKNSSGFASFIEWFIRGTSPAFRLSGEGGGILDLKHDATTALANQKTFRWKSLLGALKLINVKDDNTEGATGLEVKNNSDGQFLGLFVRQRIVRLGEDGLLAKPIVSAETFNIQGASFFILTGSSNVNLDYLSGAVQGQEVEILFDGFTTIRHIRNASPSYISLTSLRDYKPQAGTILRFIRGETYWHEVGAASCLQNLTGSGVPTLNALRLGERYTDTTNKIEYSSVQVGTGATDWKPVTN